MASPINDKRTHKEHHIRRYIFKLLLTLTVDRLSITTTVNDNIQELCIHDELYVCLLYGDSNQSRLQAINALIEQLIT